MVWEWSRTPPPPPPPPLPRRTRPHPAPILWPTPPEFDSRFQVKTILKAKQHSKWRLEHPRHKEEDPYYLLTRWEQVTVVRLRTGHNHLNYHLYSKLRIGHTEQCPCGTGSQTTEHLLQSCPIDQPLRKGIWPDHTPVASRLYGRLVDLRCAATFIKKT